MTPNPESIVQHAALAALPDSAQTPEPAHPCEGCGLPINPTRRLCGLCRAARRLPHSPFVARGPDASTARPTPSVAPAPVDLPAQDQMLRVARWLPGGEEWQCANPDHHAQNADREYCVGCARREARRGNTLAPRIALRLTRGLPLRAGDHLDPDCPYRRPAPMPA